MHDNKNKVKRQNIPRWYPFQVASNQVEALPLGKTAILRNSAPEIKEKKSEWIENPNLFNAIDLLSSVLNPIDSIDSDILSAANFLANSESATKVNRDLARMLINGHQSPNLIDQIVYQPTDLRLRVFSLKHTLQRNPNDPIAWLDLAHAYTCLGHIDKAQKAIHAAFTLGKHNRYIARSIARFYLHIHDPERALYVLRSNSRQLNDPWLISAEVAIADRHSLKTKLHKAARNLAEDNNLHAAHLSELQSTLGTIELDSGSTKQARRHLQNALRHANDNTLAQIEWLISFKRIEIEHERPSTELNYEADALANFRLGDFEKAFEDSLNWLHTQPFSLAPIIHASYISSLALSDQKKSIELLEKALQLDNEKEIVLNNLAVSYLLEGKIEEARKQLDKLKIDYLPPRERAVNSATRGMLAFREGNLALGQELYGAAVSYFQYQKDANSEAIARFYWAKEEMRLRTDSAKQLLEDALRSAISSNRREIVTLATRLSEKWIN